MAGNRVAIVGAGMTKFVRRAQETSKELAWEAASKALESCELTLDDIDAVVIGSAPEAFDGVHMKSEYLSDGCGGLGEDGIPRVAAGGRPSRWTGQASTSEFRTSSTVMLGSPRSAAGWSAALRLFFTETSAMSRLERP